MRCKPAQPAASSQQQACAGCLPSPLPAAHIGGSNGAQLEVRQVGHCLQ